MKDNIDILMSTYNGEEYLEEQIDSLLKQTYKNWKLIIRDDGSKDNTIEIIRDYQKKYPEKITFIENDSENIKPAKSFMRLIKYSNADYFMFCDQDDYWLENKVEITLKKMKEIEINNKNIPILVHTDLEVVDKNLRRIHKSMWKYQGINPEIKDYRRLTVENNITGCTVMLNKKVKKYLQNYKEDDYIVMHDWFLGIIVAARGKIEYINQSTILYRQHGRNDTGAKKNNLFKKLMKIKDLKEYKKSIFKIQNQSKSLHNLLKESIFLEFFVLKNETLVKRKKWIIKMNFYKHTKLKNIIYILLI